MPRTTTKKATPRKTATKTARKPATTRASTTQPRTPIAQVQNLAERAVLIQVGASLVARDTLVSTVKGLSSRHRTRSALGRELERYERRGATARTRLEHEMHATRKRLEHDLGQRRSRLERSVRDRRSRFEREVGLVRRDLEKRAPRVSKLVGTPRG
ncbi:MAG TPA: hypothetical protein VIX82_05110 [Solirubrobacteraceae bacterium]